jgi:ketosteroid isomerase-like protein
MNKQSRLKVAILTIALVLMSYEINSAQKVKQPSKKASAQTVSVSSVSAEYAQFKRLTDSYCLAWSNSDGKFKWNEIEPFYAKDTNLVFFDAPLPKAFIGYLEMKTGAEQLQAELKNMRLTPPNDLRVFRRSNIVWTTATIPFQMQLKSGQTIEFPMRQTAIWERRNNAYQIVHEHNSAMKEVVKHKPSLSRQIADCGGLMLIFAGWRCEFAEKEC